MLHRPSKLARAVTATFVAGGVAVAVLAALSVVHDPTRDAAWVAVPLGVLLLVWGVAFARLSADDDDDNDNDDDNRDDDDGDAAVERPSRGLLSAPLAPLSGVIALLAGYVAARMVGRPVDSSLVAVGGVLALWLVNRAVDRWVRRRGAGDGEPRPETD